MKILFIHGAQRVKIDNVGDIFTDGSFNYGVWERYLKLTDNLSVMFNSDKTIYDSTYAKQNFQPFDKSKIDYIQLKSSKNLLSRKSQNDLYNQIEAEVLNNDFLILRVPSKASELAAKIAIKHKKPYLLEVVGCAFDSLWTHSNKGRIIAPLKYLSLKRLVAKSDYVQYVTEDFLQKRYPTKGKTYSISDVVLPINNDRISKARFERIDSMDQKKFSIGSIGAIDVRYKGYQYVIEAIKLLKQKGYEVDYHLIGGGDSTFVKSIAEKNNVVDRLHLHGSLPHDQVIEFIDNLDLYVQPSLTEGLPRSLIESLHRGCPSIGSDIGGIPELLDSKSLFQTKNPSEIAECIERSLMSFEEMSRRNFAFTNKFSAENIDHKRMLMFQEIFNSEQLIND